MSYADIGNLGLTESSTNAGDFPDAGNCIIQEGKKYCSIYNAGAAAIAAGDVLGLFLTTPASGHVSGTATTVVECTLSGTMVVAGVGIGAIAAGSYGYIQVGGHCTNITTTNAVSEGDALICNGDATPDFTAAPAVATEEHMPFAFADADDDGTVGSGFLTGCALSI